MPVGTALRNGSAIQQSAVWVVAERDFAIHCSWAARRPVVNRDNPCTAAGSLGRIADRVASVVLVRDGCKRFTQRVLGSLVATASR